MASFINSFQTKIVSINFYIFPSKPWRDVNSAVFGVFGWKLSEATTI